MSETKIKNEKEALKLTVHDFMEKESKQLISEKAKLSSKIKEQEKKSEKMQNQIKKDQ